MDIEFDVKTMESRCEDVAKLLKIVAHPGRLKILCFLVKGERQVQDIVIATGLSQSYTSQFLSKMKSDGLIECRKEGVLTFYHICDGRIQLLMNALYEIFCSGDEK